MHSIWTIIHQISLAIAARIGSDGIAEGTQFLELMVVEIRSHVDGSISIRIFHIRSTLEDELIVLHVTGFDVFVVIGSNKDLITSQAGFLSIHIPFNMVAQSSCS